MQRRGRRKFRKKAIIKKIVNCINGMGFAFDEKSAPEDVKGSGPASLLPLRTFKSLFFLYEGWEDSRKMMRMMRDLSVQGFVRGFYDW